MIDVRVVSEISFGKRKKLVLVAYFGGLRTKEARHVRTRMNPSNPPVLLVSADSDICHSCWIAPAPARARGNYGVFASNRGRLVSSTV